ncbi:hypothetical protein CL176_05485 [Suicoccus acidiformans]|uniref:DNA-binding protein n=1 Tax=Suicoccus acidiformans TaxID=2036206 RepID=A0A347WK86_9LACT|nr:hypothetical protein CL176_05485 [Suicoccus acidiformans]
MIHSLLNEYTVNQTLASEILDINTSHLKRLVKSGRISEPLYKYTTHKQTQHYIFYYQDIVNYLNFLEAYRESQDLLKNK